jgi:hypothetical protein
MGDAGPEITNGLGAFLYLARSKPGFKRASSLGRTSSPLAHRFPRSPSRRLCFGLIVDRPRLTIGRLALGALIVLGLALLILSPQPSYEREGRTVDFVERTVNLAVQTVHERLASGLEEELGSHPNFGGFGLSVVDYEGNKFPTLRLMRADKAGNLALARYADKDDEAWKRDFFVRAPYGYWYSEYTKGGKPVPFRTDFLIHLEPIDDYSTRVEVIEYASRIKVGTNFRLCGRHLVPEISDDTQPVTPTTRDRREMLDLVVQVAQPGLPGLWDEGCQIGGVYVDSDGGVHLLEEIDAGTPK